MLETLTLKSIIARPVLLKLERPIVARIATITDWPLILIDLQTEEGVTGRSYLEPYVPKAMRYLIPALRIWASCSRGGGWRRPSFTTPGGNRCISSATRAWR